VATGQPAELKSAQLRRQVDSLKIGHSKLAQDSVFYEPKSKMMSRVIAVFEDGTIAYYHASAHPVQYVHSSQILLDPPASDRNPPPAPPPYRLPDLKISKKGSSPNLNSQTGKSGSAK
jgi:hypothetical protein